MSLNDGRIDLLVVGASAPDLVGLRSLFGESLEGDLRGIVVRSKVVGFGAAAAANTARGVLAVEPRTVVQLGTAGVYPGQSTLQAGEVVMPTHVTVFDAGVTAGVAAFPLPMKERYECSGPILAGMAGRVGLHAVVATAGLSSLTDEHAALRVTTALRVHVDAPDTLGPITAASAAGVPFVALLGLSRRVGPHADADHSQHARGALTRAAEVLREWIVGGAIGVPFGI